ncbi:general transcription factor IIH subunit [Thraustotheca clavata]|uniref:General transcription factor IIH subunit 4 n=1 Tax=Thraustotheca clavata TaxID=74557 RepID=A0A1V9ZYD0_9STRA|nr:general transcription factor IIH subunit [Thraustotheca clavata]
MNAFEYLTTLPVASVDRLFNDPWACQAVFQSLPSLAQQVVMRLLFSHSPTPLSSLNEWVKPSAIETINLSIEKLCHLRVLSKSGNGQIQLNPNFKAQLKAALSSLGGSPWEEGRKKIKQEKPISAVQLEHYARKRWDSVLHFMVGSTAEEAPPEKVIQILEQTRLMQASQEDRRKLHITDTGYEFMLKDIHAQTWIFILEYIKNIDRSGVMSAEDMLQFLFQMSYCQMHQYYRVEDLSTNQKKLLGDLVQLGLLYRSSNKSDRFYTTSLAVNLIFGGLAGQTRAAIQVSQSLEEYHQSATTNDNAGIHGAHLSIVVETNFKIYAYTSSALHIAMLSVFVDIVTVLPNLAVGFLTRESIRSALIHGISAEQIYHFLMQHAHPRMINNNPVIPENIADQLYLWQRERNRIQFIPGELFDGFVLTDEFNTVVQYAKDLNVLTWSDASQLRLTVTQHGAEAVRKFVQSIRR